MVVVVELVTSERGKELSEERVARGATDIRVVFAALL